MKKIFRFWRIVIALSWSNSLWAVTTEKEIRTMLVGINIVQHKGKNATEIVLGPLQIMIGIV